MLARSRAVIGYLDDAECCTAESWEEFLGNLKNPEHMRGCSIAEQIEVLENEIEVISQTQELIRSGIPSWCRLFWRHCRF